MPTQFRLPRPAANGPSSADSRHPAIDLTRRYAPIVIGAGLVGGFVGLGLSQMVTPTFAATSTLYFSINYGASGSDLNQGAAYTQSQMLSFAELARSARVLDPVVNSLGLDESATQLAGRVEASSPANTVVLDITAKSADPELAAAIADGVAESLTDATQDVAPRDSDGRPTVTVRTVQSAEVPTVPVAPNTRVNVLAGVVLGIAVALLLAYLRRMLDTRVRGNGAVAAAGGQPVLGRLQRDPLEGLVLSVDPDGAAAEGYRRLAATLLGDVATTERRGTKRARVIVLASPVAGGTANQAAANLAIAAAESGRPILLYSPDPEAADGMPDSVHVHVHELSSREELPTIARSEFPLALVAAPDLATSSRAITLGQAADGVVLVADIGTTHISELAEAVAQLEMAGVRVIGTVLSGFRSDSVGSTIAASARDWKSGRLPVLEHHEA
jgi:capsular polysaccharide biosynthesis protein